MNFLLKLITLILTVYVVQCTEIRKNPKSVKFNENIIYDCVDIYKQPSLSHPLLQNHIIQLEPSFSISKRKDQNKSQSLNKTIIECPNGTVPILRNTKKYAAYAQYWAKKHFTPFTLENHETHIAGVRLHGQDPYHGLIAWMTVHDLNISADQTSYTNIFVGSGVSNITNFIETGWMVNPPLFGDGHTWSYGFWKGANGTGCYNTKCPGFIQVSKTTPLSGPFPYPHEEEITMYTSILQDKKTGNWWIIDKRYRKPDENIGYWPKELFDLISTNADVVGVTGIVHASPSGKSPPMGNGHLPTKKENESARVKSLEIVDSKFNVRKSNKFKLEKLLDSNKCYGLRDGQKQFLKKRRNVFTYGGPGGNSCGI